MNANARYWDQGIGQVPRMTGVTATVMDCHEVRAIFAQVDIALPLPNLLDVGCGTGRCVQLVAPGGRYFGVDISPSAIAYCHARLISASLIDQPVELAAVDDDAFDWILAWSVFTHIGREEQLAYLAQFARIAPNVLIDILPGDAGRSAARWGSDEAQFRADFAAAGYDIHPTTPTLVDTSGWAKHQYFRGTRR